MNHDIRSRNPINQQTYGNQRPTYSDLPYYSIITALPTILERQSPVIATPTTDFCQESVVTGMRLVPHVMSKATTDDAGFLSEHLTS